MIEPRIYRAAFVPALLAFVIAMFSLESRPPAVPQALAADILFDGRIALSGARQLAAAFPDRRPGTAGDLHTAQRVAASLRAQDFAVTVDRFTSHDKQLVNVIGRRIGESTRQLVVVVPRDADSVPDLAGSASDTASLLEIARTLQGRVTQKTLVLASVDGSAMGSVGAQRLAGQLAAAGPVEAVLVVNDTGVADARGTLLVPWSESTTRSGLRLQRTVAESLRLELQRGGAGRSPGVPAQWARLSFPLGIGDQAPFLDAGMNALRLSGSGELPPHGAPPPPNANRIGSIGRATLRTVFAYDAAGRVGESPSSFLFIAQDVLPRWSIALLCLTLLLPILAASVDAFARARRRREPVLPWLRWIAAALMPFAMAWIVAQILALVGETPDAPAIALPPRIHPLHGSGWVALALCTATFALAWLFARPRLAGARPPVSSPGAGGALALVLALESLAVWVVNPFAAFALLPAFHLWLLVSASRVRPSRPLGIGLALTGLLLPAVIVIAVLGRLSLGVFSGLWYGYLLVTGHQVGVYTALVTALLVVCFITTVRIAVARDPAR